MKPRERRLSEAYPWVVAFTFGLLHASVSPESSRKSACRRLMVPLALLTFNLGVEAGQLLFVAAVLVVFRGIIAIVRFPVVPTRITAAYLIGTMATVWFFTRLVGFLV